MTNHCITNNYAANITAEYLRILQQIAVNIATNSS